MPALRARDLLIDQAARCPGQKNEGPGGGLPPPTPSGSLANHPFPKCCPGLTETNHRGLTLCGPGQSLSHSASVSPSVNWQFLLSPRNAVSALTGTTGLSEVCRSLSPACVVCLVPETPVLCKLAAGETTGGKPKPRRVELGHSYLGPRRGIQVASSQLRKGLGRNGTPWTGVGLQGLSSDQCAQTCSRPEATA